MRRDVTAPCAGERGLSRCEAYALSAEACQGGAGRVGAGLVGPRWSSCAGPRLCVATGTPVRGGLPGWTRAGPGPTEEPGSGGPWCLTADAERCQAHARYAKAPRRGCGAAPVRPRRHCVRPVAPLGPTPVAAGGRAAAGRQRGAKVSAGRQRLREQRARSTSRAAYPRSPSPASTSRTSPTTSSGRPTNGECPVGRSRTSPHRAAMRRCTPGSIARSRAHTT